MPSPIASALPLAPPSPLARHHLAGLSASVVILAALAFRASQIGNPIQGMDEQFYALVGERMASGLIPYVDIWDRKPIGLFLLYRLFAVMPGETMPVAVLAGAAFAAATALIVVRLAWRSAGPLASTLAGLFYLGGLNELWGDTPQSPVFYNLFVALAGWLTLRAGDPTKAPRALSLAIAAMLLAGAAMQIKTSAVFCGLAFGTWLIFGMWRGGLPVRIIAGRAALLALAGLLPTLLAAIGYAAIGEFDPWWQANVTSVLAKGVVVGNQASINLTSTVAVLVPFALVATIGAIRLLRAGADMPGVPTAFLMLWLGATLIELIAIGGFWRHYALPALVPMSLLAARAFDAPRIGRLLWVGSMIVPLSHAAIAQPVRNRWQAEHAGIFAAAIPAGVRQQCLLVYEGPPALYALTGACIVTPFVFSDHLWSSAEAPALGEGQEAALAAALDRRPLAIVTVDGSPWRDRNAASDALLGARLQRDYRRVAVLPHSSFDPDERLIVWQRQGALHR